MHSIVMILTAAIIFTALIPFMPPDVIANDKKKITPAHSNDNFAPKGRDPDGQPAA